MSLSALFGAGAMSLAAEQANSQENSVQAGSLQEAPEQKKAPEPEQSWKAEIGKPAPDFLLKGVDGKSFELSKYRGNYVVLEWFNPGCPVVKAAHGEGGALRELGNDATERGAIWVAVNSGSPGTPGSDQESNVAAVKEMGIDYPILLDPSGWVGRAYGAVTTPHMFVIDKRGILVYAGAHDDRNSNNQGGSKGVNFVERALLEAASGGKISTPSTRAYGCGVKYSSRAKIDLVAPNFTLADLAGEEFNLADHRGKYVVLEWFNPGCPVVKKAHGEGGALQKCAKKMTRGGVVWVAVNSGGPGKQGASRSANEEAVERWNLNHPVLLDPDGNVGKTFGAKVTPQVFVLDKRGVVVYAGAAQARDGGPNLVEQALTELSCGNPVSVKKSEAYGCGVKYAN